MRKASQCSCPLVKKLVGYKRNISFLDLSERHEIRSLFGHSSLSLFHCGFLTLLFLSFSLPGLFRFPERKLRRIPADHCNSSLELEETFLIETCKVGLVVLYYVHNSCKLKAFYLRPGAVIKWGRAKEGDSAVEGQKVTNYATCVCVYCCGSCERRRLSNKLSLSVQDVFQRFCFPTVKPRSVRT